jgi:hypothetical protein
MNRAPGPKIALVAVVAMVAASVAVARLLGAAEPATPPPDPPAEEASPADAAATEEPRPAATDTDDVSRAPEAAPGERVSADNNVSFPVDI